MSLQLPDRPREDDDARTLIEKLERLWEFLAEKEREVEPDDDSAEQIAAVRDDVAVLTNTIENVRGDGRIQVHASRYGLSFTLAPEQAEPILLPKDPGFPAKILTETGSGAYTFEEEVLTDGTTWTTLSGGRTGTCYESNDVAGIAVGTIIKIRIEYDTTGTLRYVFDYSTGVPSGTADWDLLVWDQTTDKAWEVLVKADADYKVLQRKSDDSIGWDWVRAH